MNQILHLLLFLNEGADRGNERVQNARRAAMLRDILVHIPSERPIRPVVDAAVSLAVTRAAHLDAVSIGYETTNVDLAPDGGAAIAVVIEIEHELRSL